jgi:hypothetical protein
MRLQPQPVPIPQRRFSHLHIDLVGPLQYSDGFNFIFTVTDRTSKWMEAGPLSDTSAAECTKALLFSWISRFWLHEMITRGTQFTSNIWSQLCEMLHISHCQTTAYQPESKCSRKTPSPSHECALCLRRHGDLVQGVTFCTFRPPCTAEGRHWSLPGLGSFWRYNCPAQRIFTRR